MLVRENVRALRHPSHWKGMDSSDQEHLLHAMAETHLEVHVLPAATAQPAAVDTRVYGPYHSGGVLLTADGAMEVTPNGDTLGWGALVADAAGVLATAASGVLTRAASPWASEWAGKLEAWRLAETLGNGPAAVRYVGADCISATLDGDGGVPSQSPWVDRVRVAFAEALGRSSPTCMCQRSTTPSGPASCPTCRHPPTTWPRWAWASRAGTYPLPSALDGTAQLFSSRRLVTAVPREMDRLCAQLAAPSVTFVRGPPGDDQAGRAQLLAWEVPKERLRFAAWVRMAPSTHTSAHAEFHCAYCSQPCKGWGDDMARSCPVVLAAALTGFRAICALLRSRGYAVCWRDSLGTTVYDKADRTSHWRLVRDEDVVLQSESAAWEVAITWSGLMWTRAPQPWPARERAALMAGYLQAVGDGVVHPPPARWSRLMRAGRSKWPVGLSRPLADVGTLLRYAMGESACAVAGPRPELVGRAVPVSVLDPAERRACPHVILSGGTPPSLRGTTPEVVLAPPATSRALFPGFTLQPLGDGPLLAFPAGAAPPGLLAALQAFFPMEAVAPGGPAGGGQGSRGLGWRSRPGLGARRRRGRRVPPQLVATPPPPPRPPRPRPGAGGGARRLSPRRSTPPAHGWDPRCNAQPRGDPAARTRRTAPLRRALTSPPGAAARRPSIFLDRHAAPRPAGRVWQAGRPASTTAWPSLTTPTHSAGPV